MARIYTGDIVAIYILETGEKVSIRLRRPSNEEVDAFFISLAECIQDLDEGDIKNRVLRQDAKRAEFFDSLFIGSENFEDENGTPITKENLSAVPAWWKHPVIIRKFEHIKLEIKNS